MKEFTGYKCDHCGKLYQREHACETHERKCMKNPVNHRDCLNFCSHLDRRDIEYDTGLTDYLSGEPVYRKSRAFHCNLKKQLMLHPKVENENNLSWVLLNGEESEQFQMPRKCEEFSTDALPF